MLAPDHLDNSRYDPETPLISHGQYAVFKLRTPRVADNMTLIWNYAIVNIGNGVPEVHTDTYPGAMSMMLKLDDGIVNVTKHIQELEAEKKKALIQAEIRERKTRLN
jgi:formiminotetrahydrofolate cyclodeaminase